MDPLHANAAAVGAFPIRFLAEAMRNPVSAPEDHAGPDPDDAFQARLLDGVSRTFALTIPQLPPTLARVVSNAYLLCRIMDTIEDEAALSPATKRDFSARFVDAVAGLGSSDRFSGELAPLLSVQTLQAEHELIRETPRVLSITHRFPAPQRDALARCVRVMGEGMVSFQEQKRERGLADLATLDRYCYHVAGVVGEMLTRLFCEHSPEIALNREKLIPLAVSFGQGLQMTNILKDIWTDLSRGACWLPRDVFAKTGFDLNELAPGRSDERFARGLETLVAIAHAHLKNAVRYAVLIPAEEVGIRNFCLWAIGMAVLTLRKISRHPNFQSGDEVKISRRSVRATVVASRLAASRDRTIRLLFHLAGRGLPSIAEGAG